MRSPASRPVCGHQHPDVLVRTYARPASCTRWFSDLLAGDRFFTPVMPTRNISPPCCCAPYRPTIWGRWRWRLIGRRQPGRSASRVRTIRAAVARRPDVGAVPQVIIAPGTPRGSLVLGKKRRIMTPSRPGSKSSCSASALVTGSRCPASAPMAARMFLVSQGARRCGTSRAPEREAVGIGSFLAMAAWKRQRQGAGLMAAMTPCNASSTGNSAEICRGMPGAIQRWGGRRRRGS